MIEIVAGWDPRETWGYAVCAHSLRHATQRVNLIALREMALRHEGLYRRPHEQRDGKLWCPISNATLSTSFANSRFLTPWLVAEPWALFCDFADMLFLADPVELFALADERYAVQVVKREHVPRETIKMDGQIQTSYPRKNWSSVILWNVSHPANARLTVEMVNSLPGRDLHRFCWLKDDEIGALPIEWNWLVGVDPVSEAETGIAPKLLHYTEGTPELLGAGGPWADVWLREFAIIDPGRRSGRSAAA